MTVLAEGTDYATLALLAGAIVVAFSLGHLRRKRAENRGGAGTNADLDGVRRIRDVADEALTRIEELARHSRAEVETRLRVLSQLLARSEEVLARLEKAEGPGKEGPARGGPPGREFPLDPRFTEVYRLADEGVSPPEIADRTEFERGEVELILSLRAKNPARHSRADARDGSQEAS